MLRKLLLFYTPFLWALAAPSPTAAARYDGKLTIHVVEESSGEPLPARMELRNARGKPIRVRPEGAVILGDSLVFDGSLTLALKQGTYEFFVEAGPEFQTRQGHFTLERHAEDSTTVSLTRRVNMQQEGWWAADLDVSLDLEDMPLLMRAASIDFVPVTVAENFLGRCHEQNLRGNEPLSSLAPPLYGPWAAVDFRRGGGFLLVAEESPFPVCGTMAEESSLAVLESASARGDRVVALTASAWDLPLWMATGKLNAVQVLDRHVFVGQAVDPQQRGYLPDKKLYPGTLGYGRWCEAIYHHLLDCGIRIPPAAGSGAGNNGNPVGTNRVYAYCGDSFSRDAWFSALRAGHVMVTNGPLLRTSVEGKLPGHVFELEAGESREFQIALSLTFYERAPVDYLEILKNGKVEHQIRLRDLAQNKGRLPPLGFDASGWFAVRAVTSSTEHYQFAFTGPYYVEAGQQRRISRHSVDFFLTWLAAAEREFAENATTLSEIAAARHFWLKLLDQANAE